MKNSLLLLLTLVSTLFAMTACKTPVTIPLTGALIQITGCRLAEAKAEAKAPMLAAGRIMVAFGATTAPTAEALATALSGIPQITDQVPMDAMWTLVVIAYGEVYAIADTPTRQANLRLVLTTVGNALIAASDCGPSPVVARGALDAKERSAAAYPVTWAELGDAIRAEIKKAKPAK